MDQAANCKMKLNKLIIRLHTEQFHQNEDFPIIDRRNIDRYVISPLIDHENQLNQPISSY